MKNRSKQTCLLAMEERKDKGRAGGRKDNSIKKLVPETIPALFLLSGIISAYQDIMYSPSCLTGALLTGCFVILALQLSELSLRTTKAVRIGLYTAGVLCFLIFILYIAQGFLDTVNRSATLWNLRFKTELEQFSVNSRAAFGSLVFWCLLSACLAAFLLMLVKKRNAEMLLVLVVFVLVTGFVLGRSNMWISVIGLLAGMIGTLIFSAAPGRRYGIHGVLCLVAAGMLFLSFVFLTGGYGGLSQLTKLRADTAAWFEKFRYGEDTLPKGELSKAQGLLEGEEETLRLDMEKPQEWYLKGFVGGDYDGAVWRSLPMESYQGEYEGLLKWLETKGFSAITQYAAYNKLTQKTGETALEGTGVSVENTGAYRKYVYLPSTAESWTDGSSGEKKDWQVQSDKFFGADRYGFQAVDGAPSADGAIPAAWMQKPSGEEQTTYLEAESVYHSFTEDYYMEVDESLRKLIEEMFFSEDEEMDFNDVTAQIRKVLRRETRYTEVPASVPAGQDFVRWFLEESKKGNAVHYASAAVLAYRTAGYAARYVEGYHYSGEGDEELEGEEQHKVVLTNKNAHAWAEVYMPGLGWLPIEVVPGMYTELYTSQIIEGEPTYQVNSNLSEDGLEVDGSAADAEEKKEEAGDKPLLLRRSVSHLLFFLYICFVLYLLLELQRLIRRTLRRRNSLEEDAQSFVERYAENMERLLLTGKVTGNYNHPIELSAQVEEKIEGVSRKEYERAVNLLQKVRFGGKKLLPYEMHTLDCFQDRLSEALLRQEKIWGRIKIRYWLALGK